MTGVTPFFKMMLPYLAVVPVMTQDILRAEGVSRKVGVGQDLQQVGADNRVNSFKHGVFLVLDDGRGLSAW
ncbi:MAG: hypothetical protein JXR25_15970 [Pontiellaceae bacterium]|nr:hypothetical protein [Pontiellaceae bacterium]MBN2786317.1 hypothetical protein [Pontiellaceae bacterium]